MIKTLTIALSLSLLAANSLAQTRDVNNRSTMQCKNLVKSIERIESQITRMSQTIRTREISLNNSKFDIDLNLLKQKKSNYDRLQGEFCKNVNIDERPTRPISGNSAQCDRLKKSITRLEERMQNASRRSGSRIKRQIDNLNKRYGRMCEASE